MRTRVDTAITAIALLFVGVGAQAQTQYPTGMKTTSETTKQSKPSRHKHGSMDMSGMMQEPHHVLAMAYKDNLTNFTKALNAQARSGGTLNKEFAQAAVTEMRRSLDQFDRHLQDHMNAMGTKVDMPMKDMSAKMDTHLAPVRQHLTKLEQEVQLATPDPKKVAEHTDEMLKHLNLLTAMHSGSKSKMSH